MYFKGKILSLHPKYDNKMKKTVSLSLISTALLAAGALVDPLASCTGIQSESALAFDSITIAKRIPLTCDSTSPSYDINIAVKYVKTGDKQRMDIINDAIAGKIFNTHDMQMSQAIDSFVSSTSRDYLKDMLPLYKEDKRDIDKRPIYEHATDIKTYIETGKDGIVTYFISTYNFEGGAHGTQQLMTLNFDPVTGKTITLDDVMVPGYKVRLNNILQKSLMKHADCKDINELHDKGYLFSMDMYPSTNFVLGTDAVTFIYNQYEIAPYALGRIMLSIPYDELGNLMKKEKE